MHLQLASLFQDNAVLQRNQPLPVWGWSKAFSTVHVSLGGHLAITLSNARGDFMVCLPALPAGGPHTLKVTVGETAESWKAGNIMIGEVWLASGQSNMEWTLNKSLPVTTGDICTANLPEIRFFNVPCRAHLGSHRTTEGKWEISSSATAVNFSAVAFGFARRIRRELGVPVGIISSSWGGSFIESWMSRSALALNHELGDWLARYENEVWTQARWDLMNSPGSDGRVNGVPLDPGNTGLESGWHRPEFDDSTWATMDLPTTWQYAGHKHSGVFWFRRRILIPSSWTGKELTLSLGAIDKQDITYVNGLEVGRTGKDREDHHWNAPRNYPSLLLQWSKAAS